MVTGSERSGQPWGSRGHHSRYARRAYHGNQGRQQATRPTAAPPFGQVLETLVAGESLLDLLPLIEAPRIRDCEYVASFNWLKNKQPTIVLPGMPAAWSPPIVTPHLDEDVGKYYRDINAAHYAAHPIEPAVRAFWAQNPTSSSEDIDLFACGSTLGNLLRFVQKSDKPFRFVVELIGETVFFIRRENSPEETIPNVRGYGHAFPERYTQWDGSVRGSDSHQRLIKYDFAGFQCVVRYEGDGYLPEKGETAGRADDIAPLPELSELTIKNGGKVIPQQAMFDLKTRSIKKQEDILAGELGRLWARQIPNFILAYHKNGVFQDVRVRDVQNDIDTWEKEHADELRMLAVVISRIVSRARHQAGHRFEVCHQRPGFLDIRQVGGSFPAALSDDSNRLWARGSNLSHSLLDDSDIGSGSDEGNGVPLNYDGGSDGESGDDFTACSEQCDYCGRCAR